MDQRGTEYLGIKQWYAPADKASIIADVIAVHGLAAHPYNTWIAPKTKTKTSDSVGKHSEQPEQASDKEGVKWLQTLLPLYLPNCRIVTFGYRCDYLKNAPKRDISNCAVELLTAIQRERCGDRHTKRHIIFLAHSFGGIVVKEALVKASLARQQFEFIKDATRGVVFLGTPHMGLSAASYANTLVSIVKALGGSADRHLIHSLRKSSPDLIRLNSLFQDIQDCFSIHCFYELLPWKFSIVAVNQRAATIPGRPSEALMTNHSGLNKYATREDENLQKLGWVLQNMVQAMENSENVSREALKKTGIHVTNQESDILVATEIAEAIERLLDTLASALVSAKSREEDTRSLRWRQLWLHSWAYMLGMADIHGCRRQVNNKIIVSEASPISQTLQHLAQKIETTEAFTSEVIFSSIDAIFQHLKTFQSYDDHDMMRHILVSSSLLLSNEEIGSLCESFQQESIDLQDLATMARVDEMIRNANVEELSRKLYIDLDTNLKLDKGKTFTHCTGLMSRQARGRKDFQEILIEWKRYDESWDVQIGNILFNRVELLTEFLRMASQGREAQVFRIMECLGYCHDKIKHRLGFVFGIPPSVTNRSSYVRLNVLMKMYNNRAQLPPSVSDRVHLARLLCSAIFAYHATNWLHKGFSSHNILLFSEVDGVGEQDEDFDAFDDVQNYSILSPYVVGFISSRPSGRGELSEKLSSSDEERRYHHPLYTTRPQQKFLHEFDYYSLGVVMIEIGQWTPLSALMRNKMDFGKCTAENFASSLRHKKCTQLNSFMGDIYQQVVMSLLSAFSDERAHMEPDDPIDFGRLLEFQTDILEALGECKV